MERIGLSQSNIHAELKKYTCITRLPRMVVPVLLDQFCFTYILLMTAFPF